MQRRWAAIYIAFFLVMAVSAYSVMAVAEEPGIDLDGEALSDGDTLEIDGTTYTFSVEDGEGSIAFNETVEQSEAFANNSAIEYRDGVYNVSIESAEEPEQFDLVEEFDVESILEGDENVENETVTREDGNEYVVYQNGTTQLLDEYLPDPDRETFGVGDTLEHDNVTKTVDAISSDEVTVVWEEDVESTLDIDEGKVVTLGDTEYVLTYLDDDTVLVSTDLDGYDEAQANIDYFDERLSGLLYVIIFSLGSGALLAAMAFLPHRG